MSGFAERSGITSDRPQQRYLWTDSFAVCSFLGLWRATGDEQYRRLALHLLAHGPRQGEGVAARAHDEVVQGILHLGTGKVDVQPRVLDPR